jgi:trehalose 6-phosphate synthase
MARLIVVSNRVPDADGAGGLAVALKGALASEATWFGWSGRVAASDDDERVVTRRDGPIVYKVIDLSERDVEHYYRGFANRALWPLLHYRVDLVELRPNDLAGYRRVNRRFAQAIAADAHAGDLIWVNDYHLIPLADELRRLGINNRIGFFLHTPWPAADIWATLPGHRDLLATFSAYDLIGLQTEFDAENLASCLAREGLSLGGDTPRIAAFPVAIATAEFAEMARRSGAHPLKERLATSLRGRKMMVGVDRLDYTKGIGQRMTAYGRFLERLPAARGRVVYVQVTPKSRSDLPQYAEAQREVAEIAGRINGAYGDLDWMPIRYVNRTVRREAIAGLYRMAAIGLVTPFRDGMNLVAKEYVAAQDGDDPGVLVLSRFAGAALELDGALLVNPHDVDATAAAIGSAYAMPLHERQARWRGMFERLLRNDVADWREKYLRALRQCRPAGHRRPTGAPERVGTRGRLGAGGHDAATAKWRSADGC